MTYGIINKPVATIYEIAQREKPQEGGLVSTIADEGLYGTAVVVTGEAELGFLPVKTFYGYTGYLPAEDINTVSEQELRAWEACDQMVISGFCVDITTLPKVQAVRLISLYRGALVRVVEFESQTSGWAKVMLVDGSAGYMRNQYLWKKEFSEAGVWTMKLPQKQIVEEEAFRVAVTDTAKTYLGISYRWGGRSTAGIDCSGLTSMSYLLNGILTYRDAKIVEGYPVHEIAKAAMKKGDLLYFPGHIAMYLGVGKYIHATGRIGSGGVVINSLCEGDADYRADLAAELYAVGSIF
ncbi:MAG: SH3 domain-containing C40 family peptidase [Hungatella sp.]